MKERFELNRTKLMSVLKRNQKKEIQALAIMLDESDSTQITGMRSYIVTINNTFLFRLHMYVRIRPLLSWLTLQYLPFLSQKGNLVDLPFRAWFCSCLLKMPIVSNVLRYNDRSLTKFSNDKNIPTSCKMAAIANFYRLTWLFSLLTLIVIYCQPILCIRNEHKYTTQNL